MTTFTQLWGEIMPIGQGLGIADVVGEDESRSFQSWDEIYKRDGRVFQKPHEGMSELLEHLKNINAERILDLGCGSGRHTVLLAEKGYTVAGLDSSPEAVRLSKQWLAEKNLSADVRIGNFLQELPYIDGFFDAVIAVQSIHHAVFEDIRQIVGEIKRVLRPGGLIFISVPSAPSSRIKYDEIAPFTLVPQTGLEKGLIHYYFMPAKLLATFADFRIVNFTMDATAHYCLVGFLTD